jgi:hypothetical protein
MTFPSGNDEIGKAQGVGSQVGGAGFIESADQQYRHGKKTGRLIEIIQDTDINKFLGHVILL